MTASPGTIVLPAPSADSGWSLERAVAARRSVRTFAAGSITLAEVSQLLWAAQGVTDASGLRTAPSAGALYPLEVYVVLGQTRELAAGIYRYEPRPHRLERRGAEDRRAALARAAHGQDWIAAAGVILAITAIPARTTRKYGERGVRYVHMEAGHAAQNTLLQAMALGLGGTVVGAFDDAAVGAILGVARGEEPLYLVVLGRPA
ncbi:MAG: SagB/ThcOx family dehydrogenase [Betaproteobacteria bacterium]|nr:MAG: SagB/ThcOx family dehydrogenase [Betaproteobacteria bacterium]